LAGQWLGKTTGWRSRPIVSEGAALAVIALYSFFPPALGFLLRYTLGNRLGWFPISPTIDFYQFERDFPGISQSYVMDCMMFSLASALLFVLFFYLVLHKWAKIRLSGLVSMLLIAAIWVAGWFIAGVGLPAIRMIYHAAIPLFAFILLSMGEMTIITRTSLAETKREEYILTARAKGLTDAQIRDRHAIRNAYLPVISKAIVSLPYLIAGLAIIEYSLIWPGLGSGVFSAVLVQDVPLALGYLLFIGVFSLGARLLLELAYLALDPRLRYVVQKVGVNL
jgi:peptide/nickel transport system permease protein